MNTQELLDRANTDLSDQEKTQVALGLIHSAGSEALVSQILEGDRRMNDISSGRVEALSGDDALAMIRKGLDAHQKV